METITSRKNPLIIHMKKLGADAGYRRECGEFLCDGAKLLEEALKWGVHITAVLISGEAMPAEVPGVRIARVTGDILDTVSPLVNAQGLLFSCRMPEPARDKVTGGCHILLESVQDPGNIGAVIRTANAFSLDSVILLGGCADPYNPKAVRAAMGAIFRQRVIRMDYEGLSALKEEGMRLYAADLGEPSLDVRDVSFRDCIVCIGNEGRGISGGLAALCGDRIKIPMNPACESLNAAAAAAVIIWEMKGRAADTLI